MTRPHQTTNGVSSGSLAGVVDIHAHCGPDSIQRNIDAIDLARMAKAHRMRGVVLKNHYEPTASLACLARKVVPEVAAFGGVTLNFSVGGVNARAVDHMARVGNGEGRFVWMGSLDTEAQVRFERTQRPGVKFTSNGQLLPETAAVLDTIAKYDLVLATGHNTSQECLFLVSEARKRGVRHIVVTHAMMAPIHMSVPEMRDAASMGAAIEFVYNGLIGPFKEFDLCDYAAAIRAIGPENCILASDLGQTVNPPHPEGLIEFFDGLRGEGFSDSAIACMSIANPARLLGLSPDEVVASPMAISTQC
jgi:Family of unknown function (DUF6282)